MSYVSDPITNFVNWYSLHLPGNPFVALDVFLLVMVVSTVGLVWSLRRIARGENHADAKAVAANESKAEESR